MRATIDHRPLWRGAGPKVTVEMPLSEFREIVEWLEVLSPDDGCTCEWRGALDEMTPEPYDRLDDLMPKDAR